MTQQQGWIPNLEIEDAQIKWAFSHFAGEEDTYNAKGDHNFVVILPADAVPALREQGWSVKEYPALDEGGEPEYTLKVNISYRFEKPRLFLIKNGRKFQAEQHDLQNIKRATVIRADLIIKPSRWVRPDRAGVSAYLEEAYFEMVVSRFEAKYANLRDGDTGQVDGGALGDPGDPDF